MKLSISTLASTQFPEAHHRLAAAAAQDLQPIAFRVPGGDACTFRLAGDYIEVTAGALEDATVIELPAEEWERFAVEGWTRYGLLIQGHASFGADGFSELCRWEHVLRALFVGRPVWDPATVELPADLTASFELDDDEAAPFLQQTGYLHVVNVFSPDEVAALSAALDEIEASARQGDEGVSWTTTPSGETLVCHLKYGNLKSPVLAALYDDERVHRILSFAGHPELRPVTDRHEGAKVIFKRPGEGNDLAWHSDCGMGLHPIICPAIHIGVQIDAGTPENGQMHVLPGSHDKSVPEASVADTSDWPIVGLTTAAGDCTVHFNHTLHWAPPATDPHSTGRRTIYLVFVSPVLFDVVGPAQQLTPDADPNNGMMLAADRVLACD